MKPLGPGIVAGLATAAINVTAIEVDNLWIRVAIFVVAVLMTTIVAYEYGRNEKRV